MPAGLLLVNKPSGATSHDVVQVVRRILALRRIGHTGTLDPMAQGLLVLLVGDATKYQQALQGHEKLYEAAIRLGSQTDTGDAMGQVTRRAQVPALDCARVAEVLASFEGPLLQTPPPYSAVKVAGRPAYWWARRHRPVELTPRPIHIFTMTFVKLEAPVVAFRVRCSAGTYVRVLAESIAERLGTVGHLVSLVRLRVGRWSLKEAHTLEWLTHASPEALSRALLPMTSLTSYASSP